MRAKGWHIDAHGYVQEIVDPSWQFWDSMARKSGLSVNRGKVPQHRKVLAEHLGRPLTQYETVHHINGDKTDNRIENLQLRQGRHGNGVCLRCRTCGSSDVEALDL